MNMQIDITMNLIIDRHRKAVLKDLKSLMFGNDAVQSSYRVFLTSTSSSALLSLRTSGSFDTLNWQTERYVIPPSIHSF